MNHWTKMTQLDQNYPKPRPKMTVPSKILKIDEKEKCTNK